MNRKKVTMQDIADMAGVSKFVVSKTLNGKPGVNKRTREKVIFTAKQLGYSNLSNTSRETKVIHENNDDFIMVLLANIRYQSKYSSYWSEIIDGISDEAKERGVGIVIINEFNSLSNVLNVSNLLGIIGVGHISPELCIELKQFNIPIVLVDHEEPLLESDSVFMDNFEGISKITNYLIAMGHSKLVFVGDLNYSKSFYDRWLGFRATLEKANLFDSKSQYIFSFNYSGREWTDEFAHWLGDTKAKDNLPSGFVCANDNIAQNIMEVLKKHDFKLPEDFSITGFDNLVTSSYTEPPLTSYQVFRKFMGQRAVSKMFWRIKNQEYYPEKILITGEIIIRSSVASPKT